MEIKVKLLTEDANLPFYATPGAAGFDICTTEDIYLMSNSRAIASTGLAFEIPEGYELEIRGRSGLAFKYGVQSFNGTIDSDYRGEVKVLLFNLDDVVHHFAAGERVCQGVVKRIEQAAITPVDELGSTERGDGGFGHTGK